MSSRHPAAAVNDALRVLYRAVALTVACPDCGAPAGEPCTPFKPLAGRSCRPPVAVACYDPHKPRRKAAWAVLDAAGRAVADVRCPACGDLAEARFPGRPMHRCRRVEADPDTEAEIATAIADREEP